MIYIGISIYIYLICTFIHVIMQKMSELLYTKRLSESL